MKEIFRVVKKSGKGKQTDTQGNVYIGDWKNSLPNGKGVYTITSGDQKNTLDTSKRRKLPWGRNSDLQ